MAPRVPLQPKKTRAQFFGTSDVLEQLRGIADSDGYQIPAHLTVEVAAAAVAELEARRNAA
jgi:hypothetical protein